MCCLNGCLQQTVEPSWALYDVVLYMDGHFWLELDQFK